MDFGFLQRKFRSEQVFLRSPFCVSFVLSFVPIRLCKSLHDMPPRSILKKRPAPVETEEVEEVPASGPSAERPQNEPESESDDEELPYDSDEGESFDETDEEADEDAIREMGEGKQKGPKSESKPAHEATSTHQHRVRRAETHYVASYSRADIFSRS